MQTPFPRFDRQAALALGRDADTVARAAQVDQRVRSHGAAAVLTLRHLAEETGASWRYLRDVVARHRDPYVDISRPKAGGSTRAISSPEPVLMDVQRWILHEILDACDVHRAAYAYRHQRSAKQCAQQHLGARWLVKMDVHDFFDSIREARVFAVFERLGYTRLLSFEMARLCTRSPISPVSRPYPSAPTGSKPYRQLQLGYLPQGAPTSGALANIAMLTFDRRMEALGQAHNLVYSRYSDDITFSTAADFTRQEAAALITASDAVFQRHDLRRHKRKTRVIPPSGRRLVLGLLVDGDDLRLLPEFKRRLEVHVRGVSKFGLLGHASHRGFDSMLSLVNHVDGALAYASDIEPAFAIRLRVDWNRALAGSGFPS